MSGWRQGKEADVASYSLSLEAMQNLGRQLGEWGSPGVACV